MGPAGSGSTISSPQPVARSTTFDDFALAAQVPDQPEQSLITHLYDADNSGTGTLGAKFWMASEHATNKSVVSVPGVGNCFWETLLAAASGDPLGDYESALDHSDYKRAPKKYYRSEDCQKLLANRKTHMAASV